MVLLGFTLGYQLRLQGDFIPSSNSIAWILNICLLQMIFDFDSYFAGLLIAVFSFWFISIQNTNLFCMNSQSHDLFYVWLLPDNGLFFHHP